MNIFIYILLFYFVSNKERYYIKYLDNEYEFTLSTADDAINFFNELKEKKTIIVNEIILQTQIYLSETIEFNGTINRISRVDYKAQKGKIVFKLLGTKYKFFIFESEA